MRIGQLAGQAGVSAKALRFYEHEGLLAAPPRTPAGYRDYDAAALARVRFVKVAQAAGLTLAQVKQILAVRAAVGSPCAHVSQLLDQHAADLDARIGDLRAARIDVERLRERARGLDPADCGELAVCQLIPVGPTRPAAPPRARPAPEQRSARPGPRTPTP